MDQPHEVELDVNALCDTFCGTSYCGKSQFENASPCLWGHKLDSSLSIFERACQSETGGKQDRDLRNPGVLGHHRLWMNGSKQEPKSVEKMFSISRR